jgi:hypothetical protein
MCGDPARGYIRPRMGHGFARSPLTCALLGAALLCLAPAGAQASTIGYRAYTAAPGEENHLEISYDYDAQVFRFHDSGVASIQVGGPGGDGGCLASGNDATCPIGSGGGGDVVARLGDGNDSAIVTNQLPHVRTPDNLFSGQVRMFGGDGNDLLDAGPGIPFTGDIQTSVWASLFGDGATYESNESKDQGGNDILIGGAGDDGLFGGPGDDIETGNGGRDNFDGTPFFGLGPNSWSVYAGGADTMVGGSGSDTFDGAEIDAPNAVDEIACGTGEEGPLPGGFFPGQMVDDDPSDVVAVGPGDIVNSDCEAVEVAVNCPEKLDGPCVGTSDVEGMAGGPGAATAAGHRGKRLVLGRERFRVAPGNPIPVRVALKPRRVSKLLGKRGSAHVSQHATARSGHHRLKLPRRRFLLRRD